MYITQNILSYEDYFETLYMGEINLT